MGLSIILYGIINIGLTVAILYYIFKPIVKELKECKCKPVKAYVVSSYLTDDKKSA